jgi:Fe-S-cluster containining protein
MIHKLNRAYTAKGEAPTIHEVDSDIFLFKYFSECLKCDFCHDQCCSYGADVESPVYQNVINIRPNYASDFTGEFAKEPEFPGGLMTRTITIDGKCAFLNPYTRGCSLHTLAVNRNEDYHQLKPMVCCLFPLTFNAGRLIVSEEVLDKTLICLGPNQPNLYDGIRSELLYYFGHEFVTELDYLRKTNG